MILLDLLLYSQWGQKALKLSLLNWYAQPNGLLKNILTSVK